MALNMQIFQQLRKQANRQTKQGKPTVTATHLNSVHKPKENSEQPSQSHYNSHFNLIKQVYAQYEAALQKEQRMPRATL